MKTTQLPYARVRPHALTTDHSHTASLVPEAVSEGARRLGWLALVYSIGTVAIGDLARSVISATSGGGFDMPVVVGMGGVVMGFVVFALVRQGALSSKRLLDLGLIFYVLGTLGIAVREFGHGLPLAADGSLIPVTAECVWIVAYPLVVPNTPSKTLVASMLAASMGPLGLLLSAPPSGSFERPLETAAYFLRSNYMCAVFASVIARIVHRFTVRLENARAIGSYELVERIGAGGMGEVWRAHHRLLARPAAIKLIRSDKLGESLRARETLVQRFELEARETAALRSTHTIDVYDFGLTEDGDFYYVMELLEGVSLEQLVREFGPVEPARTVYLLRQVCHSLGEAHARGLVHRDVKPANIFACRLGPDHDFIKVLDFGLVKHRTEETALTLEDAIPGTPGYMAPEIALGLADVDGRADLYSLGCVAHFLLTGQPVFSAETPLAQVLAHVNHMPVAPSARSEFEIPAELDELILKCLAKDPAARLSSAAEVSERLLAAVSGHVWTPHAARTWWEHHMAHDSSKKDGLHTVLPVIRAQA